MRIGLRKTVDCSADELWDLIRSPAGLVDVSAPLIRIAPQRAEPFPERWSPGDFPVRMTAFGLLPLGGSVIRISYGAKGDARIMTDAGGPSSGALAALVGGWHHRLAVAPAPGGRALYRDRLEISGPFAAAAWPFLWAFWQWRGWRLNAVIRRRSPE
jgi:hypothetical protein